MMEWQANAIAPRILMPRESFRARADELIYNLKKETGYSQTIDVMEDVIEILAAEFRVSRTAAKIRCIDLGFTEAIGCYNYIDGRYIKPYNQKNDEGQVSYSISIIDAAILTATDPAFADEIHTGHYLYVDGHYIKNEPKYVSINESGYHTITDYARYHIDECAIGFDVQIRHNRYTPDKYYYRECVLNREKDTPYQLSFQYRRKIANASEEEQNKEILAYLNDSQKQLSKLPNDYVDAVAAVREWSGLSRERIAEDAGIEVRHLDRVLKGKVKKTETIVRVLLAMKLPPMITIDLLQKAPCPWSLSTKEHAIYYWAINSMEGCDVKEIVKRLEDLGYPLN